MQRVKLLVGGGSSFYHRFIQIEKHPPQCGEGRFASKYVNPERSRFFGIDAHQGFGLVGLGAKTLFLSIDKFHKVFQLLGLWWPAQNSGKRKGNTARVIALLFQGALSQTSGGLQEGGIIEQ